MEEFKISYDEEEDILYLAKEGEEREVVEVSPGVNVELDDSGKLIGVENVPSITWTGHVINVA